MTAEGVPSCLSDTVVLRSALEMDSALPGDNVRPLARPFVAEGRVTRGDRAWLAGSLALSTPEARIAYPVQAPDHELAGTPETDWSIRIRWLALLAVAAVPTRQRPP